MSGKSEHREGPEFSSNASFIRLRQANTTPERSLERSDLSATSLRTYLDSDGKSEPQPKQNSIAKPDRNPICWEPAVFSYFISYL